MKTKLTYLALAAMIAVTGCTTMPAEFESAGKPTKYGIRNEAYPPTLSPKTLKEARRLCNERYAGLSQTEYALYGPYGDWTRLVDDAKACMNRHGVRVTGFRQRDGRLTPYPWPMPKYLDY